MLLSNNQRRKERQCYLRELSRSLNSQRISLDQNFHTTMQLSTMSDNKLRAALVFRLSSSSLSALESGGAATLIAQYDHGGGGVEKNYADAVGLVIRSDPPRNVSEEGTLGGYKIVQSDMHQIVYGADTDGLCE
jgi:hypothetical protein